MVHLLHCKAALEVKCYKERQIYGKACTNTDKKTKSSCTHLHARVCGHPTQANNPTSTANCKTALT